MFTQGQTYRRRELHEEFGGQQQGGICTPSKHNVIFIFTGESGHQYGYTDGWQEGLYFYTGEGQEGDMQFVRGNAAIRDHVANGKDLFLFKQVSKGYVQYESQMVCTGHHWAEGPDSKGSVRKCIVFELTPVGAFQTDEPTVLTEAKNLSLLELRKRALSDTGKPKDPKERKVNQYQRSQWTKQYALRRAGGTCEGCYKPAPFRTQEGQPYLEVHHIRTLSDGGPDEPRYVVATCPNCHRRAHCADDARTFNTSLDNIAAKKEQEQS